MEKELRNVIARQNDLNTTNWKEMTLPLLTEQRRPTSQPNFVRETVTVKKERELPKEYI